MGLAKLFSKQLSGYPGGYKQMRRGFQGVTETPPFKLPDDPKDRRSRIPRMGFREYWYPALPAKDVKKSEPSLLRMLGTDVIFFKDTKGEVQALLDWCPHRAVYLSMGKCHFPGFISCAYHGATFDGDGNCVAFLTEGPDSKMVGVEGMKAKKFPTVTLKGMVFVWTGESEPVDPREDIPPEMFEDHNISRPSFCMFDCNWVIVLENTMDAHNAFMVHRNALRILGSRLGGRPRTPLGYRVHIVNDKVVHYRPGEDKSSVEQYYYDEDGNIPYQMYYPGVDGVWPLHRWRLMWTWLTDRKTKKQNKMLGMRRPPSAETPDVNEWNGTRLPGMSRTGGNNRDFRSTRWPVPVEENLTRMVYLNVERYPNPAELVEARLQSDFLALPRLGAELQLPKPGLRRGEVRPILGARVHVIDRLGGGGHAPPVHRAQPGHSPSPGVGGGGSGGLGRNLGRTTGSGGRRQGSRGIRNLQPGASRRGVAPATLTG